MSPPDSRSPAEPDALQAMVAEGYAETSIGPGESHQARGFGGATPPAPGPEPRMLVRFAHLTDFQLVDDESPARLASFDATGPTAGSSYLR